MAKRYKTSRQKRTAQRQYRRSRKQYKNYLEQFEARKETFESRGLDFYDPIALTYRDWKTVHAEKINDLKMDIKEGKRKSIGNVNREIVSDQAYELSSRQSDVLADYLLENEYETLEEMNLVYKYTDEEGIERINLKKKIDLMMKIRQGEFIKEDIGLWEMINDFRSDYFSLSSDEKADLIKKWKDLRPDVKNMTFGKAVSLEVGATFFNSPK